MTRRWICVGETDEAHPFCFYATTDRAEAVAHGEHQGHWCIADDNMERAGAVSWATAPTSASSASEAARSLPTPAQVEQVRETHQAKRAVRGPEPDMTKEGTDA
jgi:hypothetical protein